MRLVIGSPVLTVLSRVLARAAKIVRIVRVPLWRRALFRYGVAAGVEHLSPLVLLRDVRTTVDVGANRGQFALAVRAVHPGSAILSFEPLRDAASTYQDVFRRDAATRLLRVALGPKSGVGVLHVSRKDDSSSLLTFAAQEGMFPGTAEVRSESVPVRTLKDCLNIDEIERPALLKLDVQGFEMQALDGCGDWLNRFDWVYVECSFLELYAGQSLADDICKKLFHHGYTLSGVHNIVHAFGGQTIQADFLFARRSVDASSGT